MNRTSGPRLYYPPGTRHAQHQARRQRLAQHVGIVIAATLVAVLIARAPVMDIEVSAQIAAEAAAMKTPEPCWETLPYRVALTQENIDRLCIKVQPPQLATTTQSRNRHHE